MVALLGLRSVGCVISVERKFSVEQNLNWPKNNKRTILLMRTFGKLPGPIADNSIKIK